MIKQLLFKLKFKLYSKIYNYSQKEFWENWSKAFMDDPWQKKIFYNHKLILNIIIKEKPNKILEIGCGFGRNIKYLIENGVDPDIITATDISGGMIDKAKDYVNNEKVNYKVANIINLPFSESSFDLVIVYTVFMHVNPSKIKKALKEVKRVSSKTIIVVEQNYDPSGESIESKKYTFVHNYKNLFQHENLRVISYNSDKKDGNDFYILKK